MIKGGKIGHIETEIRKYASPLNILMISVSRRRLLYEGRSSLPIHFPQDLRVDTNGMKGVGGIEFAWGCKQ